MKLAVLITYHNEKELLTNNLNSLLDQEVLPDEVIIYDDASYAPAKNYIPHTDFPMKIISNNEHKGVVFARNELLNKARSEYVHFQDADDLFAPGWVNRIRDVINSKNPDIILTEVASQDEEMQYKKDIINLRDLHKSDNLVMFAISHVILPAASTFRRQLGIQIGGFRQIGGPSEDYDFHIRFCHRCKSYEVLLDNLIIRIDRKSSLSGANIEKCWSASLNSLEKLKDELPDIYFQELSEAAVRLASALFHRGDFKEAKRGFTLARKIKKPLYRDLEWHYRLVAKFFGPMIAEWAGLVYRILLPQALCKYMRKRTA